MSNRTQKNFHMDSPIVNRVTESGLVTIDLEKVLPEWKVKPFDLASFLYMGLVLKEKDFREAVENHDWNAYRGAHVAVFCSADAIVPHWAYMLVVSRLSGLAESVYPGTVGETTKTMTLDFISRLRVAEYAGKRVVVKGCGDRSIPDYAYAAIAGVLTPHVKSLMYGEPCSTVPVFKRK